MQERLFEQNISQDLIKNKIISQTNKIIYFPFWLSWLMCCFDPSYCGPVPRYLANSSLINYLISK